MKKLMNFLDKKSTKKLIIIMLAFLSICVFALNLDIVNLKGLESHSRLAKFFEKITKSFNGYNVAYIPMFIAFYYLYSKLYFDGKRLNKTAMFLSIFFSLFMVLGYSYQKTNSWDLVFGSTFQLFKSIIVALGYYSMFYILIKKLYIWLDDYKMKECKGKITNFIFEKHPFILPFIIILIMWLPYIVFYYPGTVSQDTKAQIYQFHHIDNWLTDSVNLLSEDVYINNNHPVLHTFILNGFLEIGEKVGNYNIGMFLYTIVQSLIFITILSYTFICMKKWGIPIWIRYFSLIFYSVLSFFPLSAISFTKDTYSAAFNIIFIFMLVEMVLDKECLKKKSFNFLLIVDMLLLMLFRNDGIYRVFITSLVFLLLNRNVWKKVIIVLFIPIILYEVHLKVLLPTFKIAPGSKREMLSVPFQQTARVIYKHGTEAFTEEENEKISKILGDSSKLAKLYVPELSDEVKTNFNKNATNKELMDYFSLWFKNFFKYPTDYIQATLNNTYGYFYPNMETSIGFTTTFSLNRSKYDIKFIDDFKGERNILTNMHFSIKKLPVISTIYSVGFYVYLLLICFGYIIYKKKYKFLVTIMPLITLILVNLLGPANGHWRYVLAIIFSTPIILSIFTCVSRDKQNC